MKTTIDSAGRLVIPKEVRRQAGLRSGMELDIRWRDGRIEIEPAPRPVSLVRKGRLLVAVPLVAGESLTETIVEQTRQQLRDERS